MIAECCSLRGATSGDRFQRAICRKPMSASGWNQSIAVKLVRSDTTSTRSRAVRYEIGESVLYHSLLRLASGDAFGLAMRLANVRVADHTDSLRSCRVEAVTAPRTVIK